MERNTLIKKRIRRYSGFLLGIVFVLCTGGIQAQSLELGLFGGGSYYLGELNPGVPFANTKPAFGVSARYSKSSRWSFKLSYTRGQVTGSDDQFSGVVNRDLSFNTTLNDIALVAEFSFWEYFTGSKHNFFSPYLFGGIGFFTFTPKSLDGVKLRPLGTEGQNEPGGSPYNQYSLSVPFGIGIKYSLTKRIAMNVEWGMRKTFTDYIDDVSTTYYLDGANINPANIEEVLSDPTMSHLPGMQRGDDKNHDWVSYAGVTLSYKIDMFSKKRCDNLKW